MSEKGSKQRPTDLKQFSNNYDNIFKKTEPTAHTTKAVCKSIKGTANQRRQESAKHLYVARTNN